MINPSVWPQSYSYDIETGYFEDCNFQNGVCVWFEIYNFGPGTLEVRFNSRADCAILVAPGDTWSLPAPGCMHLQSLRITARNDNPETTAEPTVCQIIAGVST